MPANQMVPLFLGSDYSVTCRASAGVTGKKLVAIAGNRIEDLFNVGPCGAGARAFGVAAYDAATGKDVTVHLAGIVPVTAGAAITAGVALKTDATGAVIPQGGTGVIVGYATDGAANGADCYVDLSRA